LKTYQDVFTVVELGAFETLLFCVLLTSILVFFAMSAKTGIVGEFIGFDFTWIKRILKNGGSKK